MMERYQMIDRMLLFGATGDLAARLLLPGLAELLHTGQVPDEIRVTASARSEMETAAYRNTIAGKLTELAPHVPEAGREALVQRIDYRSADVTDADDIASAVQAASDDGTRPVAVYLALPQGLFDRVISALGEARLPPGSRIVVEKPFGEGVAQAESLNELLLRAVGSEESIFRVDHALGMGTLQNLPALRFGNRAMDAFWNAEHIERVDVLWDESLALEGRATFYDHAGALIDVMQNHMLQILCYLAMEPRQGKESIADRRLEVLKAIRPIPREKMAERTRRARYTAGEIKGRAVPSYIDEEGVDPSRMTETFAEVVLEIDNDRWRGTPFRMRTGKAIGPRFTGAMLHFRPATHIEGSGMAPNRLEIGIDGPFDIRLHLGGRDIDGGETRASIPLTSPSLETELTPYAHVLQNLLSGGHELSVRGDEAVEAWRIFEPIREAWMAGEVEMVEYAAGSDGPTEQPLTL
jgi:glucose-6-phosphate 1-dehydrogenase